MIIWAVNSSSKYLVSVSEVTWGLKGGLSCGGTQDDGCQLFQIPITMFQPSPSPGSADSLGVSH